MKVLSLMKSGKSATRLDQICVRREIIQLFANMCSTFSMHAHLHIFAYFLFLERFCTFVLGFNWTFKSIDKPSSVDKQNDFQIFSSQTQQHHELNKEITY